MVHKTFFRLFKSYPRFIQKDKTWIWPKERFIRAYLYVQRIFNIVLEFEQIKINVSSLKYSLRDKSSKLQFSVNKV